MGLDLPVWIEDPDFDLDRHMRRAAIPSPGGLHELAEFVGDYAGRPLERDKPLWEVLLVEGLEGNRVAVQVKFHSDPERNVTVPREDLVETKYEVFCTDRVGNLRLVTSTTGLFPDDDGYQIVIEIGGPIPIRATDVKTVGSVVGGANRVHLVESSVADNCSVQGENPRTIVVPSGGLVDTVFDVTCGLP